jgi:hypothetical protein
MREWHVGWLVSWLLFESYFRFCSVFSLFKMPGKIPAASCESSVLDGKCTYYYFWWVKICFYYNCKPKLFPWEHISIYNMGVTEKNRIHILGLYDMDTFSRGNAMITIIISEVLIHEIQLISSLLSDVISWSAAVCMLQIRYIFTMATTFNAVYNGFPAPFNHSTLGNF